MIFSQNLISILLSKPDKQADMQLSFLGAEPLPKTPDHQKKFVAHQNSNFFILSYALPHSPISELENNLKNPQEMPIFPVMVSDS